MEELASELAWRPAGRYAPLRLFGLAVVFILCAPVFWHQTQMHPGSVAAAHENADLYQDVYPEFHYGFSRIRAGEVPLWNARQGCGTPFQPRLDTALFQPLNLVFVLLPTRQAMAVHAFLCLALMGFFFALFARATGAGYVPSLIGGVAYAFCGASAAAISRPPLAAALAWTPLVFWSLREFARRGGLPNAMAVGIGAALLLLSGAPAVAFGVACLAVPYALATAVLPDPEAPFNVRRRIEGLAFALAVALGISAVQWVPTVAWMLSLDRPWDALALKYVPAFMPASFEELLAQLFVPKPGALPRAGYLGALALLPIPALLFRRKGWREILVFGIGGAALLLVSVGGASAVASSFPYAVFLFPGLFCVAALATMGLDRLFAREPDARKPSVWQPALLVFACALALFFVSTAEPRGRIVVLVVLLAPVVVFRVRIVSALCGIALAGVLFADLAAASVHLYHHPFEDAPQCYQGYARSVAEAEEQALGARVLVSTQPLDFALPRRVALLVPALQDAACVPPVTRDEALWWRRLSREAPPEEPASTALDVAPEAAMPRLLNAMAARAVLAGPNSPMASGTWRNDGPALREVATEDAAHVFLNESARPRVSWVPSWRMAEGVVAAIDLVGQPAFDGSRECIVDRDSEGYAHVAVVVPGPRSAIDAPPEPPPGVTCTLDEPDAEHVAIHVDAPQPGIVVLADTFAPGWRATLDGSPCPILRANALYRGIATPPGAHDIVFAYRPAPYAIGMGISLVTLALAALTGVIVFARG